ncbi:MAG: sigma-70 family RNA polymerase sigma factor [Nocardioidaceae bacterium]
MLTRELWPRTLFSRRLSGAWCHWSRVRQAHDIDAYVHRVLINTFTSSRRRRWNGERAVAIVPERQSDDETENVDRTDRTDAVVRALGRLTQDQRTAVVLRYYSNLSESQMGAVLGVAPGTVKSRLSRAFKILSEDPNLAELRGSHE